MWINPPLRTLPNRMHYFLPFEQHLFSDQLFETAILGDYWAFLFTFFVYLIFVYCIQRFIGGAIVSTIKGFSNQILHNVPLNPRPKKAEKLPSICHLPPMGPPHRRLGCWAAGKKKRVTRPNSIP